MNSKHLELEIQALEIGNPSAWNPDTVKEMNIISREFGIRKIYFARCWIAGHVKRRRFRGYLRINLHYSPNHTNFAQNFGYYG